MIGKKLLPHTLYILLTLTGIHKTISQNLVFEKSIHLKSGIKDNREVLPIVIEEKRAVLILLGNLEITAVETNEVFQEIDYYKIPRPNINFNDLLGYSINNSAYSLFFSNNKKNQFYIQTIDITNKQSNSKISELKLKKEKFLESFTYQNRFYIFSVKKMSSIIKLYEFDGGNLKAEKEFDLSRYKFSNSPYFDLYSTLSESITPIQQNLSIAKIDNGNPVPLEIASNTSKMYSFDEKVFITIDNILNKTQIISINLNTYEHFFETIKHEPLGCEDAVNVVSNSYLTSEVLFQIKASKSCLVIRTIDLQTKEIISEYEVAKDENITFKNTPIMQEGGTSIYTQGTDKELEKTKEVLRKISNGKIGISAYPLTNQIVLTVGGYKEVQQGNGVMTYSPETTISTPYGNVNNSGASSYNSTLFGYSNYKNTRSVHFKTLLDKDTYNHIEGMVSKNPFDQIKDFEDASSEAIRNETIFRIDNFYIFGYYSNSKKTYSLYKFQID
jgi:hypothetical protein